MKNINKLLFEMRSDEKTEDYINRLKETCCAQDYRINRLSEFFAYVSHELRTPLNSIICFSQQLIRLAKTNQEVEFINIIKNSSKNLLLIATDLLDFSKIESGKLKLAHKKFNIKNEIEEVMCLVLISAYSKGLNLNFFFEKQIPELIVGDPLRIKQILCNLVTNAIKYTNHGEINCFISFEIKDKNNADLMISVQDTGIGISKEAQANLFNNFNQLDNTESGNILDSVELSSGLGLAIVKKLVLAMNGNFGLESKLNHGSKFWFRIPVKIIKGPNTIPSLLNKLRDKKIYFIDIPLNTFNSIKIQLEHEPVELVNITSKEFFDGSARILNNNIIAVFFLDPIDKLTSNNLISKLKLFNEHYSDVKSVILLPFSVPYTVLDEIDALGKFGKVSLPFKHNDFCNNLLRQYEAQSKIDKKINKNINNKNKLENNSEDKLKILVVDDQVFNLRVMETFVQNEGHLCVSVNNTHDAIKYIKTQHFDLVFLDIQLPDLSGIEALEIINGLKLINRPKIFALTAGISADQIKRLKKLNFEKIIKKPLLLSTFKALINNYKSKKKLLPILPKFEENYSKNVIDLFAKNPTLLDEFKKDYKLLINKITTSIDVILVDNGNLKDNLKIILNNLHNLKGLLGFLGKSSFIKWIEKTEDIISKDDKINIKVLLSELSEAIPILAKLNL